jgi:flagellar hook-basal body complex protein FliE
MIPSIGQHGSLARTAIEAALAAQQQSARRVEARAAEAFPAPAAPLAGAAPAGSGLLEQIGQGIDQVGRSMAQVERLPFEMATGGIQDFSELAAHLKQSELTFKFVLEVRNKLIDAYRETMRMSV